MKAVMYAIRPEHCAKILNGEKTVEIRKTKPLLPPPFKSYIYCTKGGRPLVYGDVECASGWEEKYTQTFGRGREEANRIWDVLNGFVVAEFICPEITEDNRGENADILCAKGCLTLRELRAYGGDKTLHGIHITSLHIYDEPKHLWEFSAWRDMGMWSNLWRLERPPQSWCYVEELT